MAMLFSDDSDFEANALQRAVDADRETQPTPGEPPRLAVRVVLVAMAAALLCALASVALWGTWR